MTASKQAVKLLIGPLVKWLRDGGDPWAVNLAYWDTRRELMDLGETFDGPPGSLLSNIDTAMDSFSPDAERGAHQIDEAQLRRELSDAIAGLKQLGYLTDE
jgi:hypothetical protein